MSQTSLLPNQAMALSQLYVNEITDERLLEALARVPREKFVPPHMAGCAYVDEDLNIGEGRYMLAPLEQARLIQAAGITAQDSVLDVACGAGCSTAIIARLAGRVIGIDSSAMFKQRAEEQFKRLGINNAQLEVVEDITQGYKNGGPYDVILLNGNLKHAPEMLISQLKDGGRLVFVQSVLDARPGVQGIGKLTVATRNGLRLEAQQTVEVCVPRLTEFDDKNGFNF